MRPEPSKTLGLSEKDYKAVSSEVLKYGDDVAPFISYSRYKEYRESVSGRLNEEYIKTMNETIAREYVKSPQFLAGCRNILASMQRGEEVKE